MQDSKEKQCLIFVRNNANDTADRIEALFQRKITRNFMQHMSREKRMLRLLFIRLNWKWMMC